MISVECNADETLVRALGFPKRQIIHCKGKSEVIKKLVKGLSAIGIVDEDPGTTPPSNIKIFNLLEHGENESLFGSSDSKLIVLSPKLEDWILERAKSSKVNLREHKLTNDASRLHDLLASKIHQKKFENLLLELISKKDKGLQLIESWLKS